jgi:type VI secretion system protein VasG
VGYGEGGILTESVRRKPYSLILLDEVEKAHGGVHDIFYQVFDKGTLKDGQGRDIDFKNTLIILTSNVGSELLTNLCADPDTMPDENGLIEMLKPELLKVFKPAFLGRVTIIPYVPLNSDMVTRIIELQIQKIKQRVLNNHQAELLFSKKAIEYIASQCLDTDSGARAIEQLINARILPELSTKFLKGSVAGKPIRKMSVGINNKKSQFTFELN